MTEMKRQPDDQLEANPEDVVLIIGPSERYENKTIRVLTKFPDPGKPNEAPGYVLYALAMALRMEDDDFIKEQLEWLKENHSDKLEKLKEDQNDESKDN